MSASGRDEVNILSQQRLAALHVTTPAYETTWTIMPTAGDFSALAKTTDPRGTHFIHIMCAKSTKTAPAGAIMLIDTDGGRTAKLIADQSQGQELAGDTQTLKLEAPELFSPHLMVNPVDKEHVGTFVRVTPRVLSLLQHSSTVGYYILQPDGLFVGFTATLTKDGHDDIQGIMDSCH